MYMISFFNDTATTEIYTLSLHDALPIWGRPARRPSPPRPRVARGSRGAWGRQGRRSEEHTSELQSRQYLACRLLLEKKTLQYLFYCLLLSTTFHYFLFYYYLSTLSVISL